MILQRPPTALHNGALRRLVVAYAGSAVSEWASWLAVLVYAEDRSGSAAAGWTALFLLVPCIVVAPFVARLADGVRPIRALTFVYAIQAVALAVAAWMAHVDAPVAVVTIPAAVAIGGIAFIRPSFAVVAPALVRTARELTESNLWAGYCDSGSVLVGPILATLLLAGGGPALVLLACAILAVVGVAMTTALRGHDRQPSAAAPPPKPRLADVARSVRDRRNVPGLLTVLAAQHIVMGFIGLMFVVLAVDELDMGGTGAGILNIAFGVGAVCSTVGATVVVGRGRLAPVIAACLGASAVAMMLLGVATTVAIALVTLAVAGFSRSLLDVSSRVLLQRSAPPEYLATVFAFIEVITSVGLATGTMLAQLAVATVGPRAGFVLLAVFLMAVLTWTRTQVWNADRTADVPVVAIALLRSNPVFAPLPPAALETVARAAVERHVASGVEIIEQGAIGDTYFAIASGDMEVVQSGVPVLSLHRGDGVGEVALLTDVLRTATVVTTSPSVVFEIDREPFLIAVTGHESAYDAAWRHMSSFGGESPD